MLRLDNERALSFLSSSQVDEAAEKAIGAHNDLVNSTGIGSEFLGWRRMLEDPNDALLEELESTATRIRRKADVLLCLGIGGSYLGARAVIEALSPYYSDPASASPPPEPGGASLPEDDADEDFSEPEILFAGHHLSGSYLRELLDHLEGKSVFVNMISKSGTTLEPALAFRLVRDWMEDQYDDADDRIVVTTDPSEGALNVLQAERGYKKYEIPRDVGGRFSVLTPVGLLPIAVAGIDIRSLFYGAVSAFEDLSDPARNDALEYAGLRYELLNEGYNIEVLAHFEPRLSGLGGWWQQLFGESLGKEETGLYPSVLQYSTDLHSLGQYMQQGQRSMIETFLMLDDDGGDLEIPDRQADLDGLNYLSGETMSHVTQKAYEGTRRAHHEGGVPTMTLWLERLNAGAVGHLIYFFEHAVAVNGYLLNLNPFDQPGVEAYKTQMFNLLGKPSKSET